MTTIEEQISNKSAIFGIMGLGYVGLPLARAFIEAGQAQQFTLLADTDAVVLRLRGGNWSFPSRALA